MKKKLFKVAGVVSIIFSALMALNSCKILPVKDISYYSRGVDAAREGNFEESESCLSKIKSRISGDIKVYELTIVIAEEYLKRNNLIKASEFAGSIPEGKVDDFIAGRKFEILGDVSFYKDEYLKSADSYILSFDSYGERPERNKIKEKIVGVISEKLDEEELTRIGAQYGKQFPAEEALFFLVRLKALNGDIAGSKRLFERYKLTFPGIEREKLLKSFIQEREKSGTGTAIGCILPLSGTLAGFGEYVKNGIITAQIIRSELMGYQQVELIFKDSAGIPEKAAAAFEEFAKNSNVIAVIGPLRSACIKACAPLADQYHLPLISPAGDADYIDGLSPYVFRTCLLPEAEAVAMAEFAVREGIAEDIAILHGDDFYGRKLSESFTSAVKKLGGNVRIDITYPAETNDFSPYVKKLYAYLKSGGLIDTIYLPCDFDKAGLIIPQLPYNDMAGFQIYGSSGWDSGKYDPRGNPERLLEIVYEKNEIEGAVFTDSFSVWTDNSETKEFIARYRQIYDSTPNVYAAATYDSYMIIVKQLKKRTRERDDLNKMLSKIRNYDGISGRLSIYEKGKVEKIPFFIKIFGGRFKEIKPENGENG